MEKRWTFICGLTVNSPSMANSKWQTIPNDRTSIRKCAAPGISCVWSKCVNEQRDWEGVYSWRRSVRYLYNTRNTYIQQTIKMLPHKIWLNVWLYNTFSTNLTRLLVPLANPVIWCFVRIRTRLFQFYRSSARWVLVSNCNNLALKENRKQNNASTPRQSYLRNPCSSITRPYIPKWSVHCQRTYSEFDFD